MLKYIGILLYFIWAVLSSKDDNNYVCIVYTMKSRPLIIDKNSFTI